MGTIIFLLMASAKIKWRISGFGRSLLHQGLKVEQTSDGHELNASAGRVMRRQRSVSYHELRAATFRDGATGEWRCCFRGCRRSVNSWLTSKTRSPIWCFTDSTLKSMAQQRPQTLVEFIRNIWVGSHKLALIGPSSQNWAYCKSKGSQCKYQVPQLPCKSFPETQFAFHLAITSARTPGGEIAQKKRSLALAHYHSLSWAD